MAAKEEKVLERTYTVPLRKEYLKAPNWKRTPKAVIALKQFLAKHMKAKEIRLGKEVNDLIWKNGIRNPPHKIKVNVSKNKEGVVTAELFGLVKKEKKSKKEKKVAVKEAKKEKKTVAKKEEKKEN